MNILIPTDFSNNAESALNCALDLYRSTPCTFYLLNAFRVYDPITGILKEDPGEKEFEEAGRASEEGLDKLLQKVKLKADPANHCLHTISIYGITPLAIREVSREKNIDLIVMGTKEEIYSSFQSSRPVPVNKIHRKDQLSFAEF